MAAASRPASTPSTMRVEVAALGAGEILLTSMDRDGTGDGFDLALTRAVADAVPVPVVASGGVGTLDHLVEGVRERPCLAVLAASIFHFGDLHDPRGQGAYGRRRHSGAARRLRRPAMTDFTLADLAAIVADARALRRSRLLYGEAARPRASARCAKKFGEEAVEAVIAAVDGDDDGADRRGRRRALSSARLLEARGVALDAVMAELERRTAQTGLEEKASRPPE